MNTKIYILLYSHVTSPPAFNHYSPQIQATTPDGKSPPTGSDQLLSVYTTVRYELTLPDQSLYSSSMFEGTYPAPGQNITLPASGVVPVVIAIPDNATSIDIKVRQMSSEGVS